jgi:hypothetical protein
LPPEFFPLQPLSFQIPVDFPILGLLLEVFRPLVDQLGFEDPVPLVVGLPDDLYPGVSLAMLRLDRGRHGGATVLEGFEPSPISVLTDLQFEEPHVRRPVRI